MIRYPQCVSLWFSAVYKTGTGEERVHYLMNIKQAKLLILTHPQFPVCVSLSVTRALLPQGAASDVT
jgi:hypothetical protein